MKNQLKLLLVLIMSATVINECMALGNEHSLILNVTREKEINLQFKDLKGKVQIYLIDSYGQTYGKQKVKVNQDMRLNFDISNVDSGSYSLIVREDFQLRSIPVTIDQNGVSIQMDELSKVFFPRVNEERGIVSVRLLSNPTNDLDIQIHSAEGDLLFDQHIDGTLGLIKRRFKFLSGAYKMTVSSDSYLDTFYFTF